MEKMVQLGSPGTQPAQGGREGERAAEVHLHRPGQDHFAQGGPRLRHRRDGVGDHGRVARRVHGSAQVGHAHCRGRCRGLGRRGAVLPDDGVEELVGVGQRHVGRPDRGGPAPRHPVGVARGPHGEARHDDMATEGVAERQRAEGDGPRPQRGDLVVARDGGECGRRLAGGDEQGGAPPHQRQTGPVEEHRRAAVELQRVRPVLERNGAGVQRGLPAVPAVPVPVTVRRCGWPPPSGSGRRPGAGSPRRRTPPCAAWLAGRAWGAGRRPTAAGTGRRPCPRAPPRARGRPW